MYRLWEVYIWQKFRGEQCCTILDLDLDVAKRRVNPGAGDREDYVYVNFNLGRKLSRVLVLNLSGRPFGSFYHIVHAVRRNCESRQNHIHDDYNNSSTNMMEFLVPECRV